MYIQFLKGGGLQFTLFRRVWSVFNNYFRWGSLQCGGPRTNIYGRVGVVFSVSGFSIVVHVGERIFYWNRPKNFIKDGKSCEEVDVAI